MYPAVQKANVIRQWQAVYLFMLLDSYSRIQDHAERYEEWERKEKKKETCMVSEQGFC